MSDKDKKNWGKFKEEHQMHDEDACFEHESADACVQGSEQEPAQEGALEHPDYAALEEQLTLAEKKAHEHWEKSVRALAELDNMRRRMEREVSNAHKYGSEKLICALLPVVDSLEQALQLADKESDASMHEGLELTMKLFSDVLAKFDVVQLDPVGQAFNPQQHEAMAMQEAPGAAANSIIAVFQKGYTLNERVIRPARVLVAKNN